MCSPCCIPSHTIDHFIQTMYSVTNLALSIDPCFENNDRIIKAGNDVFVYYNKLSSDCGGPEIAINLLDQDGRLCTGSDLPAIQLQTQLVYENGIPVPLMPIKPLRVKPRKKDKGSIVRSVKPIFIRKYAEPVLEMGQSSTKFAFDLAEVTYHHHGHDGFKVRVSARKGQNVVVHPAVMNELMVVLSKPQKVTTVEKFEEMSAIKSHDEEGTVALKPKLLTSQNNSQSLDEGKKRKADDLNNHAECAVEPIPVTKRRKVSADAIGATEQGTTEKGDQKSSTKLVHILQAYNFNGNCFQCNAPVTTQSILKSYCHTVNCSFAANIIPRFNGVDLSILEDYKEEDGYCIPAIMESKSFEESCKKYIANSPCEMVDSSIFDPNSPNDESDNDEKALSLPIKIHDDWREHARKIWDNTSFSTSSVLHTGTVGEQRLKEEESIHDGDGSTRPVLGARGDDGVFAPISHSNSECEKDNGIDTDDGVFAPISNSRNAECEKDSPIDTFLGFLDNAANAEDDEDDEVKWFHMKKNADGSVDF